MKDTKLHILIYDWIQPLLRMLQEGGVPISPDTHVQLMKVFEAYSDEIKVEDIVDYISPIVVKNQEHLTILREIWPVFLKDHLATADTSIMVDPLPIDKSRWMLWKYVLGGFVLIIAAVMVFLFRSSNVVTLGAKWREEQNDKGVVLFSPLPGLSKAADTQYVRFAWDFGDGSRDSSRYIIRHTYKKQGIYKVKMKLAGTSPEVHITREQDTGRVVICYSQLALRSSGGGEYGSAAHFELIHDTIYRPSKADAWYVNDVPVKRNSFTFDSVFSLPGNVVVSYKGHDSASEACQVNFSSSYYVRPAEGISILLRQEDGDPLKPRVSLNIVWILIPGLIILLLLMMMGWMRWRLQKRERASLNKLQEITDRFKGDRPPFDLPFRNHNELIDDETTLLSIAKNYNRRNPGSNFYLNIEKTIQSTIRMEGMISPVYGNRTRPVEFLMLIDKSRAKNQQVKLFEYLLAKLGKNDLSLEKFYFQSDPAICTNPYYPQGIHLSRLRDLYPDHILTLFGPGHQLIDPYYPSLHEPLANIFKKWDHWAICTPVNIADWNYKEEVLNQATILYPADLKGQLLLFRDIANIRWEVAAKIPAADVYHAGTMDLDDVTSLSKYLRDAFLFQWVCAISVYPRIQWDVLVAIGEQIQRWNYPDKSVNYSALLKIVRIGWMQNGVFPDDLRLEMLKQLEPRNEKVARETMIRLLDEAARGLDVNVFSYEQVQMQQMANQFMLYAHDPEATAYREYKAASDGFKVLWEQGKVKDYALSNYLKKPAGKKGWSGLIDNKGLSEQPVDSAGIDEYFNDSLFARRERVRRTQWALLGGVMAAMILLILLLISGPRMAGNRLDHVLHFTAVEDSVAVHFGMAFNSCLNYAQMRSDSVRLELSLPDGIRATLDPADTAITIKLSYSSIRSGSVQVVLQSPNHSFNAITSFPINTRQLRFEMNGCRPDSIICQGNWKPAGKSLDTTLTGDWLGDYITAADLGVNTSMHIEPRKINGQTVTATYVCSKDNNTWKIILRQDKGFGVIYFKRGERSGAIMYYTDFKTYSSEDEARNATVVAGWAKFIRFPRRFITIPSSRDASELQKLWINGRDSSTIEWKGQNLIQGEKHYIIIEVARNADAFPFPVYKLALYDPQNKFTAPRPVYLLVVNAAKGYWTYSMRDPVKIVPEDPDIMYLYKTTTAGAIGLASRLPAVNLPQTLNEIWHNSNNGRLINIDLDNRKLYYSTGARNTYGTYTIDTVIQDRNGDYRIIVNAHPGYNEFQLRNVKAGVFELSFCDNRYASISSAIINKAGNCNTFNKMTPYYESDNSSLYVPVPGSDGKNSIDLNSPAAKALIEYARTIVPAGMKNNHYFRFRYYHSRYIRMGRPIINDNRDRSVSRDSIIQEIEMNGTTENPFQRDYWKIDVEKDPFKADSTIALNSLSSVTIGNTMQIMGFYLQDAKGNKYGLCTLPGERDYKKGQEVTLTDGSPAGMLVQVSGKYPAVGLIRLNANSKPFNGYNRTIIAGIMAVDGKMEGQTVIMLNANSKTGESSGILIGQDNAGLLKVDKVDSKPPIPATGSNVMLSGTAGSVLLDKNNYGLGILVSEDAVYMYFVPLSNLIKEFNLQVIQ